MYLLRSFCASIVVRAVVVMDNLPAHKLASIAPMIEAVGAKVLCLSPYSPDFKQSSYGETQIFFYGVLLNYNRND